MYDNEKYAHSVPSSTHIKHTGEGSNLELWLSLQETKEYYSSYFKRWPPKNSANIWSSETVSPLKPAEAARAQAVVKSCWTVTSRTSMALSNSFLYCSDHRKQEWAYNCQIGKERKRMRSGRFLVAFQHISKSILHEKKSTKTFYNWRWLK